MLDFIVFFLVTTPEPVGLGYPWIRLAIELLVAPELLWKVFLASNEFGTMRLPWKFPYDF